MTGIVTAAMISLIMEGSDMRATPPSTLISAGTRSRAMTAQAPASSAMRASAAVVTSMEEYNTRMDGVRRVVEHFGGAAGWIENVLNIKKKQLGITT